MSASRVASKAIRAAARTSAIKGSTRNAQQPARRYASTSHGSHEKSSDMPWFLSALAITLPAAYIMRPSNYAGDAHHAPAHKEHAPVAEKVEEVKTEAPKVAETVKEKAAEVTESAKAKAAEATETVKEKASAGSEIVSETASAAKEKLEGFTHEKTETKTPHEAALAGETNTHGPNNEGAGKNILDRLENGAQRVGEQTSEKVEEVKEKAEEKTEEVKEKAEEVKEKAVEAKEVAEEKVEETAQAVSEKAEKAEEKVEEKVEETKAAVETA